MAKVELHIGGGKFEELVQLFENLTGRAPTPEEVAEARATFEHAVRKYSDDQPRVPAGAPGGGQWTGGGPADGYAGGHVRQGGGVTAHRVSDALLDKLHSSKSPQEMFNHIVKEQPEIAAEALKLINRAEGAQAELKAGLERAATDIGAEFTTDIFSLKDDGKDSVVLGPIKSLERTTVKAALDYEGDVGRVKDIVRGSIAVNSADEFATAVEHVKGMGEIVGVKDRMTFPGRDGYRDVSMLVKLKGSEMLAEIQLHAKPMIVVKQGEGHKLFERMRVMDRGTAAYQSLVKQSKTLYDSAWGRMGGGVLAALAALDLQHLSKRFRRALFR